MKSASHVLMLLLTCTVITISCNKGSDITPTPVGGDTLKTALPVQIFHTYHESAVSPLTTEVFSIKYDTVHYKIEIYTDDTTNANPYDALVATYTYNSSGYLISYIPKPGYNGTVLGEFESDFKINRGTDNKIISIVATTHDLTVTDTIFYNYQTANGETTITNYVSQRIANGLPSVSDPYTFTYDLNGKLIKSTYFAGSFTYAYNLNNSVDKIIIIQNSDLLTADYIYASGIPDGKADFFRQSLLGKDYYLPGLQDLDPFCASAGADFEQNNIISITDPYHVTNAHYEYPENGTTIAKDVVWMYELNEQKNLSKATITAAGEPSEIYRLIY